MSWFRKKDENIKIINTGGHLPDASIEQELRFMGERDRFVKNIIESQAKVTGNIIYGSQAVNAIVGPVFSRPTSDWDVFSRKPRVHAVAIEKRIDNFVGADIAFVKQVGYDRDGVAGRMYRVSLKNWDNVADFNRMPRNVKTVVVGGVRYESLDLAEKKYLKMIRENDTKRIVNANQDLDRVALFKYWKKIF